MITQIWNAKIITETTILENHIVVIDNDLSVLDRGYIQAIVPNDGTLTFDPRYHLDLEGKYLSPAFIDLQVYGALGKLFSTYPFESTLEGMTTTLVLDGTTGYLATLATNTNEVFEQAILTAKKYYREQAIRPFMGLHLEGPFLSPLKKGAHIEKYIRKANLDELKRWIDLGEGVIKMITIAPELQDDEVLEFLLDQNILVSVGHSNASFAQANSFFDKGISMATHLFNAMSPLNHREPGLVGAILNHPKVSASIIADGYHVDFSVIQMAKRLMGECLFLITDAVTETTEGPYQHRLEGGRYVMPDGALSGSDLTMLKAVKNCVEKVNIDLVEAVKMASLYPARLLKIEKEVGSIEEGKLANLVVFDQDFHPSKVFLNGEAL